jgi:glutathione S-transferase
METQLEKTPYLVGDAYTVADIALYAYTHEAHLGGFDMQQYPAIQAWLKRVAAHPGHVALDWLP